MFLTRIILADIIFLVLLVSYWFIFTKAGQPGWTVLIPIYNTYKLIKVACKPGWYLLLLFIPLVNLIVMIYVMYGISKKFGHGIGFTVGLIFLPFIFLPILAFGSSEYVDKPKERRTRGKVKPVQRPLNWRRVGVVITLATIITVGITMLAVWPYNAAATARNGDTVKVAYIGTYDNSSVFDSANSSAPLQFTIGNSSMIPGFDKGIIGMSVNQTKTIHVAPEDGYGPSEFVEDINELPSDVAVGQHYFLTEKPYIEVIVKYVNESTITLQNLNEMAGQNLNFEITLVELIKATKQTSSNTSS